MHHGNRHVGALSGGFVSQFESAISRILTGPVAKTTRVPAIDGPCAVFLGADDVFARGRVVMDVVIPEEVSYQALRRGVSGVCQVLEPGVVLFVAGVALRDGKTG